MARTMLYLCMLLAALDANAETLTWVCSYDRLSDDVTGLRAANPPLRLTFMFDGDRETAYVIGNNGSAAVTFTPGDLVFTFTEVTKGGSVQTTSITPTGPSVHSRHTASKGSLFPSQYYGRCTVQ